MGEGDRVRDSPDHGRCRHFRRNSGGKYGRSKGLNTIRDIMAPRIEVAEGGTWMVGGMEYRREIGTRARYCHNGQRQLNYPSTYSRLDEKLQPTPWYHARYPVRKRQFPRESTRRSWPAISGGQKVRRSPRVCPSFALLTIRTNLQYY